MIALVSAALVAVRAGCAEPLHWAVCAPVPLLAVWGVLAAGLSLANAALGKCVREDATRLALATVPALLVLAPDFVAESLTWRTDLTWQAGMLAAAVLAAGAAALVCARASTSTAGRLLAATGGAGLAGIGGLLCALLIAGSAGIMRAAQLAYLVVGAGVWASAVVSVRDGWRRQWTVMACCVLGGILAAGAAAHLWLHAGDSAPRRADRPDVFLITIDTLRADAVGEMGMRRLALDGVTFEGAIAQAPWTPSSVASLLTSRHPSATGYGRKQAERFDYVTTGFLDPGLPTLAEVVRDGGYATVAVVTNSLLKRRYGFAAGFERFDHVSEGYGFQSLAVVATTIARRRLERPWWLPNRAEAITELAAYELAHRHGDPRPLFMWVHYIDPHAPYGAPGAPRRFSNRDLTPYETKRPPEVLAAEIRRAYELEVRYVDREVAALFDEMDRRDCYRPSLVVLTSDHGEEFWEHDGLGHSRTLHAELVRVPLFIKYPGNQGARTRIGAPVGVIDVTPTVLQVIGLPPAANMRGLALAGMDDATLRAHYRRIFSEALGGDPTLVVHEQKALRTERHALISTPAAGRLQAFDRRADPHEKHDLLDGQGELAAIGAGGAEWAALAPELDEWTGLMFARVANASRGFTDIDPGTRRQLEALGYIR